MRVFAFGAWCCSASSFYKACTHIINYSTGYQTCTTPDLKKYVTYDPNHIEINTNFTWALEHLVSNYATIDNKDRDIVLVHIVKERQASTDIVLDDKKSKKANVTRAFKSIFNMKYDSLHVRDEAAMIYDCMVSRCNHFLRTSVDYYKQMNLNIIPIIFRIERYRQDWKTFWHTINAKGNFTVAISELTKQHNKFV